MSHILTEDNTIVWSAKTLANRPSGFWGFFYVFPGALQLSCLKDLCIKDCSIECRTGSTRGHSFTTQETFDMKPKANTVLLSLPLRTEWSSGTCMLIMGHHYEHTCFTGIVSFRSWRIFLDMYDSSLRATAHNDVSKAPRSFQPRSGLHFISSVTELPATLPFQPSTHPKDTSVLLCCLASFCPNSQWNTFNLSK